MVPPVLLTSSLLQRPGGTSRLLHSTASLDLRLTLRNLPRALPLLPFSADEVSIVRHLMTPWIGSNIFVVRNPKVFYGFYLYDM